MIELKIPKLGVTMEDAKLLSWQFKSGDEVKKGETLFTIETDKVTFEVPSPSDGIIHPVAKTGETYPVNQTVGYLAEDRGTYERLVKDYPSDEVVRPEEEVMVEETSKIPETVPSRGGMLQSKRIKATPLARKMAAAQGLRLAEIRGTGPGGRIVKDDISRILKEKEAGPKREAFVQATVDRDYPGKETLETIPISGVRRVIFDNMVVSLSQTAQLTMHTEASGEALVDLRDRLSNRSTGGERTKVSYNAILVKIVATALRLHPKMNASVVGDEIRVWRQVHIGIAMEAEDALLVPVVRNPDLKSIHEINQQLNELIAKTKENRLSPDDLANGTFTISNLGFADIDYFTPILRPPESALLGVGRIVKKPVVKDERIIPEARIGLSLTFDHRIIDGAPAARFLKILKEIIEYPLLMIA